MTATSIGVHRAGKEGAEAMRSRGALSLSEQPLWMEAPPTANHGTVAPSTRLAVASMPLGGGSVSGALSPDQIAITLSSLAPDPHIEDSHSALELPLDTGRPQSGQGRQKRSLIPTRSPQRNSAVASVRHQPRIPAQLSSLPTTPTASPSQQTLRVGHQHYRRPPKAYRSPSSATETPLSRPSIVGRALGDIARSGGSSISAQVPLALQATQHACSSLAAPSQDSESIDVARGAMKRPGSSRARTASEVRPMSSSGRLFSAVGLRLRGATESTPMVVSDPVPTSVPPMNTIQLRAAQAEQESRLMQRSNTSHPARARPATASRAVESKGVTESEGVGGYKTGKFVRHSVLHRPTTGSSNHSEVGGRPPSLLTFGSRSSSSGTNCNVYDQPLHAEYIRRDEAEEKGGDLWDEDQVRKPKTSLKWKPVFGARSKEKMSGEGTAKQTPSSPVHPPLPQARHLFPSSSPPTSILLSPQEVGNGITRQRVPPSNRPQTAQPDMARQGIPPPPQPGGNRGSWMSGSNRSLSTGPSAMVQSQQQEAATQRATLSKNPRRRPGTAQALTNARSSPALLCRPSTSGMTDVPPPFVGGSPGFGQLQHRDMSSQPEARAALESMIPFKRSMVVPNAPESQQIRGEPRSRVVDRAAPMVNGPAAPAFSPLFHVLEVTKEQERVSQLTRQASGPLFQPLREEAAVKERNRTLLLSPLQLQEEAQVKRLSSHATVIELRKTMKDLEEAIEASFDQDSCQKQSDTETTPASTHSRQSDIPSNCSSGSPHTPTSGTIRTTQTSMESVVEEDEEKELLGEGAGDETVIPPLQSVPMQTEGEGKEQCEEEAARESKAEVKGASPPTSPVLKPNDEVVPSKALSATSSSTTNDCSTDSTTSFSLDDIFCQVRSVKKALFTAQSAPFRTGPTPKTSYMDRSEEQADGEAEQGQKEASDQAMDCAAPNNVPGVDAAPCSPNSAVFEEGKDGRMALAIRNKGVLIREESEGHGFGVLIRWEAMSGNSRDVCGTGVMQLSSTDVDAIGRAWIRRKGRLAPLSKLSCEDLGAQARLSLLAVPTMVESLPEAEKVRLDQQVREQRQADILRSTSSTDLRLGAMSPADDSTGPSSARSSCSTGTFRRKPLYLVSQVPIDQHRTSLEEDLRSDDSCTRSRRLQSGRPCLQSSLSSPQMAVLTPSSRASHGARTPAAVGTLTYNRSSSNLRGGNACSGFTALSEEAVRAQSLSMGHNGERQGSNDRRPAQLQISLSKTAPYKRDNPPSGSSDVSSDYGSRTRPYSREHTLT